MDRQSWDKYFFELAEAVSKRSTCPRAAIGAILTKNNRIVSTGYNGSKPGEPHCIDVGCMEFEGHCLRTVHAEQNAMDYAVHDLNLGEDMLANPEPYKLYVYGPRKVCKFCREITKVFLLDENIKEKETDV